MIYRRSGRSGLQLPLIALGLWQNAGAEAPFETARALILGAFDLGITYFDVANNYGRPPGSAEQTLGRVLKEDLLRYRDELIVATKAGYDMWPGPYGEWGSRKYLIASLDQSLRRLGIGYVDVFYVHRFDPHTPLEETMLALADIVRQGKALYVGISSYGPAETRRAVDILHSMHVPVVVHQPSYSLFNRWIESEGLLDVLGDLGVGCVVFTALEQGLLTDKYASGGSEAGRMGASGSLLKSEVLTVDVRRRLVGLASVAQRRGQTLAQMAIAWVLRQPGVTGTVVGARTLLQLKENVASLEALEFAEDELNEIEQYAGDLGITLWPPNC